MVLEELKKVNKDWNTFLFLANYDPKIIGTPSKRITLVSQEKVTLGDSNKKREKDKGKEKVKEKKRGKTNLCQHIEADLEILKVIGSEKTSKRMKGKQIEFTLEIVEKVKPRKPMTGSKTKKLAPLSIDTPQIFPKVPVHQETEQFQEITYHEEQDDRKVRRLKSYLKEAQDEIVRLREENKEIKVNFRDHMDLCDDVLTKSKIMVRNDYLCTDRLRIFIGIIGHFKQRIGKFKKRIEH